MASPVLKKGDETPTHWYSNFDWLRKSVVDKGSDQVAKVANDNSPERKVLSFLSSREKVLNASESDIERVKGHTVDRYLVNAEQDSDRHLLKGDIEAANSNAAPVIKDSAEALEKGSETWRDEEKLEKSLDNLDHRLNVVQAEAEKNGENIDRQEALERLKAEADRFTNQDANGRYSMKTRLDVIKDNWENRKGFWQFLKTSFADLFFKYGAVRTSLPGLNLINYAQKEAQEFKEEYGELGEDVLDKANQTRRGLRHKKNIEKEGPEALMLVKSGLSAFRTKASVTGKQALLDLVHGKNGKMNPKEYVMKNIDTSDLAALEKKYPKTFASQAQHYGVKARKLKGKAAVFELSTRLFDWYLHPAHRTRASVGEEVKEVAVGLVPFSSTFSFLQDGAAELNHLPTWAKYSILAGEFGLDVATTLGLAASVFTGGTVAPVVAGASFAGKTALRTGVRKMATKSVEKSAARNTAKGAMGVVSKMGTKTRETLFSTFSAKVLVGYGSLSALSALADYAFAGAVSHFAVETAEDAVEKIFNKSFTEQQKRALKIASYAAVRQYQNQPEVEETTSTNEAPSGLTEGQKAAATIADQERNTV